MLAFLVVSLAVTQSTVLRYDDGASAGPNDYSSLPAQVSIKELVCFQAPRRMRISAVNFMSEGKPGTLELHFWKDIDAQIPFRHFEFDVVKPVAVKVSARHLSNWK